eukprot:scaffold226605_cov20-Tisochrysis_lutea.AAC.2
MGHQRGLSHSQVPTSAQGSLLRAPSQRTHEGPAPSRALLPQSSRPTRSHTSPTSRPSSRRGPATPAAGALHPSDQGSQQISHRSYQQQPSVREKLQMLKQGIVPRGSGAALGLAIPSFGRANGVHASQVRAGWLALGALTRCKCARS